MASAAAGVRREVAQRCEMNGDLPGETLIRGLRRSIDRLVERHNLSTALEMVEAVIRDVREHPPTLIDLGACLACGRRHAITTGAVEWLAQRGFALPRRCASCRASRQEQSQLGRATFDDNER